MDVMGTIAALSNGLEILKKLKDIDLEFDRAKYKAQVAELMSTLAEAKISLLDAREQLQSKDVEVASLKETFEFARDSTVIQRGMRYQKAPDGNPEGMPFCDRCEKVGGRLIRIVGTSTAKDGYKAICPQCKADYGREHGYTYWADRKARATG
jgi:hypothetical protein